MERVPRRLLEQSGSIKEHGEGLPEEMMPPMSPTKGGAFNQGERDSRQKEEEVPKAERH